MSRLLDGMPYTPSVATDIRKTFARVDAEVEWRCRLEGAREVMRKLSAPSNVRALRKERK